MGPSPLARVLELPARHLTFGARAHAIRAGEHSDAVARSLELGNWTCHVCGIRLPGLMEFDGGHGPEPDDIRPICQICHNLDHAVWAAGLGRLVPIWAPDIPQPALTRICWITLALSRLVPGPFPASHQPPDDEEEVSGLADEMDDLDQQMRLRLKAGAESARLVLEMIDARRGCFAERFEATTFEAWLEALLVHLDRRKSIEPPLQAALNSVRTVPALLVFGYARTAPEARISAWESGRFVDVSGHIGRAFVDGLKVKEG
ncbi:MAG: hypothetical protein OXE86_12645 [Alphaproteobacteria bacterium]|nr:hypothetical protein [Alphaproteobacteria bacterium]